MAATSRPGVRWDRLGRVALLGVLLGVLALYINPLREWWGTTQEAKVRNGEVQVLQRERNRLQARVNALRTPAALEREARKLGMVRVGERPFVVRGLPPR